jgi:hypothetical protein
VGVQTPGNDILPTRETVATSTPVPGTPTRPSKDKIVNIGQAGNGVTKDRKSRGTDSACEPRFFSQPTPSEQSPVHVLQDRTV